MNSVANSAPTQSPPSVPLSIRKGEKLDKIVKMLRENGFAVSSSKGGHSTFENNNGYKLTVPMHDQHISNIVRRSLVQRLNNMSHSGGPSGSKP